jgi:DNA-binding FadR family transcriptional regulator
MLSHGELFEALTSHDPDRAEQAMRRHLHASRQLVQQLF